jgi:hypothetical protein
MGEKMDEKMNAILTPNKRQRKANQKQMKEKTQDTKTKMQALDKKCPK